MVKLTRLGAVAISAVLLTATAWAAEAKPNFSGNWVLDKDKSDLTQPPVGYPRHTRNSRTGVPGIGGGGTGWPGMGGPRIGGMGGPGMGGPRRGGPDMGDPGWGGTSNGGPDQGASQTGAMGSPAVKSVPYKLVIDHSEPKLTVTRNFNTQGDEPEHQLRYTTDGKSNENILPDGKSVKSKTNWEGSQLVTKSNLKTSGGKVEIIESRSLSADHNIMTVEVTAKGDSIQWTRNLVYKREAGETKTDQTEK